MKIAANRVISGTFGSVQVDGIEIAEVSALQAKVSYTKEDVQMSGQMAVDQKVTGYKGTGSLTLKKVYTRFADFAEAIKKGKDVRATVISNLDDPDAYGAERVAIYNVSLDDLTLADWAVGKTQEVTCPFTFTDWEFLGEVKPA